MEDLLKLNVDGAIFFDHNMAGIEAILRNNKGETIMGAIMLENEFPNPETIESLAILRRLQLCAHLRHSKTHCRE